MSAIRLTTASAVLCALLGAHFAVHSQTQPAASESKSQESVSDRTRRLADNPLKWIMMQDDKPRRGNAPAGAAAAGAAQRPATPAAAAAAAPAQAAPAGTAAARPAAAPAAAAAAPAATAASGAAARPAPATPATPPANTVAAAAVPAAAAASTAAPAAAVQQPAAAPAAIAAPTAAAAPVVEEDQELKLVKQVAPEIGRSILQRGIRKGDVRVSFTVMPDGTVTDAAVVTSTNSVLNAPILAAVRQWRYEPIKRPQQHGAQIAFDLDQ